MMVTISQRRVLNMETVRIVQNSVQFGRMVEQFTGWQTEIDSYRMTYGNYREVNNVKIGLPWKPGCNWQVELSHAQLTSIQATNEKGCASEQRADALAAYHLSKDQANLVQAWKEIWILHGMLNGEI